jgi:hypothetical protein
MKIYALSGLHLQFADWSPPREVAAAADVIVLAGDIDQGVRGLEWARRAFGDKQIVYVPGNDEYRNQSPVDAAIQMRSTARKLAIHLLEGAEAVLSGVRFLGGSLLGPDGTSLHDWLAGRLSEPFPGPTVGVTYHVPTRTDPDPSAQCLGPPTLAELDEMVSHARLWLCGRAHRPLDVRIGNCRVIATPPHRDETTGVALHQLIHLSDQRPVRLVSQPLCDPVYSALKEANGRRIARAIEEAHRNGTLRVARDVAPIRMELRVHPNRKGPRGPGKE